jgi:acyl-coenzyme A thioesterase PaaI-like protein
MAMSDPPKATAVQDHYPDDFSHCYGCGRLNTHGLHVRSFREGDDMVARFVPGPHHMAMPGFVYGGLVASLVDCHAMAAAAAAAERRAGHEIGERPAPRYVTAVLQVEYLRPTPLGPELHLRARVREASERKTRVDVEVSARGEVTARGEVLAVPLPASMRRA